MKYNWKYVELLLYVYVLTIPINGVLNLPIVGSKIQLPEIVFIALFIVSIFQLLSYKTWLKIKLTTIDKAIIFYGFALLISGIGHPTKFSFFEFLGFLYLVILYLIINIYFIESDKNIRKFLVKSTQISSILTSVIGLTGLFLITISIKNPFVGYYENYPILGSIYRLKALTTEPIMLMSILGVFALISIADFYSKILVNIPKKTTLVLLLLNTTILFTFTKSIIMFAASCLVIIATHYQIPNKYKSVVWGIFLIVFIFFSHFTFVSKSAFNQHNYYHSLEKRPILELPDRYLLRNAYGVLKEANLTAFSRFPLIGLGGGNFTEYVDHLKEENLYPNYFQNYDPLSTYFGALSELGLLGFVSLMGLYLAIFNVWGKIKLLETLTERDKKFWVLMSGVFLFVIAEGFVTDTMNFRHYWLILSCLAAQERRILFSELS